MGIGRNKTGTNCQTCEDCEPMVGSKPHNGITYRCYGEPKGSVAVKRDLPEDKEMPPKEAPDWCPHRTYKSEKILMSEPNTIRIVRAGAALFNCEGDEVSPTLGYKQTDTVLLNLDELSVNPCEGCANSDSSRRYWNCNHDCRKYVGYQAEQALIAKLKEASKLCY